MGGEMSFNRVSWNYDTCEENKTLDKYCAEGLGMTVFEHRISVWERALRTEEVNDD
jgi:hypothetical protein